MQGDDTNGPPSEHSTQAGRACTDDGRGCCDGCGVALVPCECGGLGYHTLDCELLDWLEDDFLGVMLTPPRVPLFAAITTRPTA